MLIGYKTLTNFNEKSTACVKHWPTCYTKLFYA